MTPFPILHVVFFFLVGAVSVSASTLAISASTVCGVASNATVYCTTLKTNSSPVAAFVPFSQVSGGPGLVCGLRVGRAAFFCWPPAAPQQLRRVYNGPAALADLAVGGRHVAAYDKNARQVRWWRGGSRFPLLVDGDFRSLVSGEDFTCAVETNSSAVRCWGPRGGAVQSAFFNFSASSLAAGGTHACAVDSSGTVLCSDAGAGTAPPSGLFGLAVADSYACGLLPPNHTAVCWSLGGPTASLYYPAIRTEFEFLVAGGNLTCGLVTTDFTVLCWSSSDLSIVGVPLPPILPGECVSDRSCECGVYPRSDPLCSTSGGGVICDRWCRNLAPPPVFSSPPSSPPGPAPPESSKGVSKGWVAFAVVGAVGAFAGVCSIVYCLVFGFCGHKKVHNSVQPTIAGGAGNAGGAANAAAVASNGGIQSPYGSPNGSRSRSLFGRQRSRVMTRQRSGPSSFKEPAEEFTFSQLAAATKDFALDAKIGAGSFGTVYRGKLPDGREVAIKRGESGPRTKKFQEKESAFRSELAFLSRLHHKHLVGLVGYCEENDERLLVYEYMKNGALYDHLHPKACEPPPASSPVVSSWKMRIKVLLDASRGIEYLHSYAVPPIIHRDIKSSNILLDASWVARVSDFGLSLMGPQKEDEHLCMKAAGTVGYMDPEYYGLNHLTVKSDVYGFGVVMLEVLTGKRAIFKEEGGSPVSVVDYAVPSIASGEVVKVLDGRAPELGAHEAEAVELVAYTAVHCVRLEGKDRPAMADIVANLETALALCEGSGGLAGGGSMSSASASINSME